MSKGIDIPIDELVGEFVSFLWTTKTCSFYGRIFRNERVVSSVTKISPEIYTSADNYIEVLKDTTKDAQCFFDVEPNIIFNNNTNKAKVGICFMVNLYALYPALTRTEATEQVHIDVMELLKVSQFDILELIAGFNGFSMYDWGVQNQSQLDMSPHYLFRFNTELEYLINNC